MPLAVLSAMRESSGHHISVKGGKFLEAVAQADTIVFDKTGTLTYACPTVARGCALRRHEGERNAASGRLPGGALSPLHGQRRGGGGKAPGPQTTRSATPRWNMWWPTAFPARVDGRKGCHWQSPLRLRGRGLRRLPQRIRREFDALPPEYSHLYLAVGGTLAAVICIADPLRQEAKEVIAAALRSWAFTKSL